MKITDISIQAKNKDRVNISVDGKYRFSLDIFQVGELGLKKDTEYTDEQLTQFETESQFGKLYARTLEYCLMRPHSAKEVRDYLWRKTRDSRTKTGELKKGVPKEVTERVYNRLLEKGYINDEKFTRYWLENRNQTKGASKRKLVNELRVKGVAADVINAALVDTARTDETEIMKIIAKKRAKYTDNQKLMQYLARQGFSYDDIKYALANVEQTNL